MWNRIELKAAGKANFKRNYWQCVLVTLLMLIATAGTSLFEARYNVGSESDINMYMNGFEEIQSFYSSSPVTGATISFSLIALALSILVLNPLEVGCQRFFITNQEVEADVAEVGYGFRVNYGRNVKTQLLVVIYVFLWSLLLIIPGIIKSYSYRMVPYILAEDPDIDAKDAITMSREMMDGHKWNAFVLDLSFLGWIILGVFTAGLLWIFYVFPYLHNTNAQLYLAIKRINGVPIGNSI